MPAWGQLLAMWCVPRSRSTVFERAMAERGDLAVVHEPVAKVAYFGTSDVVGTTCRSERQVTAHHQPFFERLVARQPSRD